MVLLIECSALGQESGQEQIETPTVPNYENRQDFLICLALAVFLSGNMVPLAPQEKALPGGKSRNF